MLIFFIIWTYCLRQKVWRNSTLGRKSSGLFLYGPPFKYAQAKTVQNWAYCEKSITTTTKNTADSVCLGKVHRCLSLEFIRSSKLTIFFELPLSENTLGYCSHKWRPLFIYTTSSSGIRLENVKYNSQFFKYEKGIPKALKVLL